LFSRGFQSSGVGRLPRTNWRTDSEPITRVSGNGFAWQGDRLPNPLLPKDSAEDPLEDPRFNAGFYWEAHEAWESFWHALGRTTPEARCVQGLIHLTAACVKIREGKAAGVKSHTQRARELMAKVEATNDGGDGSASSASLGSAGEPCRCFRRTVSEKRCQEPFSDFLGRPRGRTVVSRHSRLTTRAVHRSSPYGVPRPTECLMAASSASVCAAFTCSSQPACRRTGHGARIDFARASPWCQRQRLLHRQSSARRTRFARKAFRST